MYYRLDKMDRSKRFHARSQSLIPQGKVYQKALLKNTIGFQPPPEWKRMNRRMSLPMHTEELEQHRDGLS